MNKNNLKQLNVVGAAIINNGYILCAKRGYGELTGMYEFPGGKIEPGESPEQALIREIKEELDVDIKVNRFIVTSHYDYPTFHINLMIYECEIISGMINDHEHSKLKWVKKQDLKELTWCPADVAIIDDIMK